jgi:UDP-GlcNAc:undecaprenyl-phosphate GlcNAc-1-phosphate transferase
MKTTVEFLVSGTLALLLTLICIPIIKKIAVKTNLVDRPNYRKVHATPVPLVGGIAIAFSFLLVILLTDNRLGFLMEYLPILTCGFVLLSVGVIDDKKDVSAKYKLAIQLLLSFSIAFSGTRISSLNGLFGIYEIVVWVQYLLTIICNYRCCKRL